jgi:hypothetical protein
MGNKVIFESKFERLQFLALPHASERVGTSARASFCPSRWQAEAMLKTAFAAAAPCTASSVVSDVDAGQALISPGKSDA